ncbi:hypothetical protein [Leptolyngbya phage Lbo-JY46]
MSSIIESPEFLRNIKRVPTKDSVEYDSFWQNEREKVRYGVVINGVFIHGWLYWHINLWNIYMDAEDPVNGEIVRVFSNPLLRDNEWEIASYLKQAEDLKKGIFLVGARRLAKTQFIASYVSRAATIYKGSENVVVGNNKDDINNITVACDLGLNNINPYFYSPRIADDWKKQVTLGYKEKKSNKRIPFSHIYIRNTEGGINTEVIAGLTPKTLIFDEIGKGPFLDAFNAAKKSFATPFGWRCVPILVGTGGAFEKGNDAEKVFYEPDVHNMLSVELKEEPGKKTAVFMGGTYSLEFPKKETTLSDFLGVEKGSELDIIPIYVSDHEKSKQAILEQRKITEKSSDIRTHLKSIMYLPLNPKEAFLKDSDNDFPIEAAQQHLEYLLSNPESTGTPVKLFRDLNGKVVHSFDTSKKVLKDYPTEKGVSKDAPIMIYEFPMENPPHNLYIGGSDPYNQSASAWSDSLGTVYIFKRLYDVVGGTFQRRIVASYAARPQTMKEWHENVELLLEFYNAVCMPENEGGTMIQYFDQKGKAHLLADGYNMLKEISPNTSIVGRVKGLPATPKVQGFWMNLLVQYTQEEIIVGADPITHAPIKKLGIYRINDPVLLKEMIAYSKDANVDRIVAFGHALAYDAYLEKHNPIIHIQQEKVDRSNKKPIPGPFVIKKSNPFAVAPKNPFGIK